MQNMPGFHSNQFVISVISIDFQLIINFFSHISTISESELIKPTFTMTTRGNLKLAHEGYTYVRASSTKDSIRWRCSYSIGARYACLAKAFTYNKNGNESAKFIGMHCHPPKH